MNVLAICQLVEFLRSTIRNTSTLTETIMAINDHKVIVCDFVEIHPFYSMRCIQMLTKTGFEKTFFCVAWRNVFKTKLPSPGLHLFATRTVTVIVPLGDVKAKVHGCAL